jgi:hypothetical protein
MRSTSIIVLSLAIAAAGVSWGYAQQRTNTATLTALDYSEIEQLYTAYTHAIDFGDADGHDYAEQFTPDGMFVNVTAPPPAGCQPPAGWHAGGREAMQGSVPDKIDNVMTKACISTLSGTQELTNLARVFHTRNHMTHRHVYTNLHITPMPGGGAAGFVYMNELIVSAKAPAWWTSGIYEDTLVKTPAGWRFKKRINSHDGVLAAP